jgi:transposase
MDMENSTLITLAWELFESGMGKTHIAEKLHKDRETIRIWLGGIESVGLLPFLEQYAQAKRGERSKRKIHGQIKQWIWDIREREYDCCGQKVRYFLKKEHNISLSISLIYEILNEKFVIKSKWKKGTVVIGPVPTAENKREIVQMDTIDFGDIFAFTAVDIVGKDVDVFMAPNLTSHSGHQFLDFSMPRRFDGHVKLIQTDGGPEFKEEFSDHVLEYCDERRVSRAYKKNEQSFIESFNRTVRKECLGWQKYRLDQIKECQALAETFLQRYHYHRPHLSLGMKPPLLKY